jgi:Fic family protein
MATHSAAFENGGVKLSHVWEPIGDLPPNFLDLSGQQLPALAGVWREQRERLTAGQLQGFMERLQREWAIETGVIERLYSLDRGVTQMLIEQGLDAALISHGDTDKDPELVISIIRDQKQAVEAVFDYVRGKRPLSSSYVHELHQLFTRNQHTTTAVDSLGRRIEVPLRRGRYKQYSNNPVRPDGSVHEYAPPEHVDSEMDTLFGLHERHVEVGVPPEIEAAWFHHRFTQIHPYQDGNGRVARALASHIFIKAEWFPLTITRDERERYLAALELADKGNLRPLVDLFSAMQVRAFTRAMSLASDVQRQDANIFQVIAAVRDVLQERGAIRKQEWDAAKASAAALQERAQGQFQDVVARLREEVAPELSGSDFYVDQESAGGRRTGYYHFQVVDVARKHGYFANTRDYHAWTRLVLKTDFQSEILLSLHTLGRGFRGVVVASLSFFRREPTEGQQMQVTDLTPLTDDVFHVNYLESEEAVTRRFKSWFQEGLVRGLDRWYQGL